MKRMKGVVITGTNTLAVSEDCPLPEKICPTGALIRPLIWSPCTSDAHLCATGCASLPYLLGKAVGHEMCGEIIEVGPEVHDFKPGDRVIVCSVMPVWRSLEAQDEHAKNRQDNMYAGIDYPDRGGSFVEQYYIRDADMNLTKIPEGVTLEQAVMVPDMMCTAFEGVQALNLKFGQSVAVLGIGPVGLMAVRAAVLPEEARAQGKVPQKLPYRRWRRLQLWKPRQRKRRRKYASMWQRNMERPIWWIIIMRTTLSRSFRTTAARWTA